MLFNSLHFLVFLPIVLCGYYIIPKKIRYIWLLGASYYFYMCWNAKYAVLIFFSTISTYLIALFIEKYKNIIAKKLCLILGLTINLLILFVFKYFNFVSDTMEHAFRLLNINIATPHIDVLLPVGISFYTFQALSYIIDVYRGGAIERNFFRYALFVSFFPQLVAGPIERSKNLIIQLRYPKPFDFDKAREGFLLMLWGFFLKIVLADRISIFVDAVYSDYVRFPGFFIVVATMLFSVQIYCDFYGYSVIAQGSAKLLGIELMENFNAPYFSQSVSEFWRRWHISLTTWFKDYVYIPLGGSRKGVVRKYINKMIVFLISGLWHGARFSFVVWGGLNGLYQILGVYLSLCGQKICDFLGINVNTIGHKFFRMIITYILIDFSWIFFRAQGFKPALRMIKSIITIHNWRVLFDGSLYTVGLDYKNFCVMVFCIFILIFADFLKRKGLKISLVIGTQNALCRWLIIGISVSFILVFGIWGENYNAASFIYFQF